MATHLNWGETRYWFDALTDFLNRAIYARMRNRKKNHFSMQNEMKVCGCKYQHISSHSIINGKSLLISFWCAWYWYGCFLTAYSMCMCLWFFLCVFVHLFAHFQRNHEGINHDSVPIMLIRNIYIHISITHHDARFSKNLQPTWLVGFLFAHAKRWSSFNLFLNPSTIIIHRTINMESVQLTNNIFFLNVFLYWTFKSGSLIFDLFINHHHRSMDAHSFSRQNTTYKHIHIWCCS